MLSELDGTDHNIGWYPHNQTDKCPVRASSFVDVVYADDTKHLNRIAYGVNWAQATKWRFTEAIHEPSGPLNKQVGGDHYKTCKIQPVEYIHANGLGFLEGCVLKRITRHNKPSGKGVQDIDKAIHELQLLKELTYG